MRRLGFILLSIGLIGIILDNLIISCICTILGSIIAQGELMYRYKNKFKYNK